MSLVNPSPTTGRPSTPLSGVLMDTEYYVVRAFDAGARDERAAGKNYASRESLIQ